MPKLQRTYFCERLSCKNIIQLFVVREPNFVRRIRSTKSHKYYINDASSGLWYLSNTMKTRTYLKRQMRQTFRYEPDILEAVNASPSQMLLQLTYKIIDNYIEHRFDKTTNDVFVMKNGVFDLKTFQFRSARLEEYCMQNCGWSYDSNLARLHRQNVETFFKNNFNQFNDSIISSSHSTSSSSSFASSSSLVTIYDNTHWLLKWLASMLHGKCSSSKFLVLYTNKRQENDIIHKLFTLLQTFFGKEHCEIADQYEDDQMSTKKLALLNTTRNLETYQKTTPHVICTYVTDEPVPMKQMARMIVLRTNSTNTDMAPTIDVSDIHTNYEPWCSSLLLLLLKHYEKYTNIHLMTGTPSMCELRRRLFGTLLLSSYEDEYDNLCKFIERALVRSTLANSYEWISIEQLQLILRANGFKFAYDAEFVQKFPKILNLFDVYVHKILYIIELNEYRQNILHKCSINKKI